MASSILMLLLVLAAIPLALWLLKRLQLVAPGGADRPLQVAAQLALGARERVVLLRVQDRLLVLGVTAQQVTLLGEGDPSALAAAPTPGLPDFGSVLRGLKGGPR